MDINKIFSKGIFVINNLGAQNSANTQAQGSANVSQQQQQQQNAANNGNKQKWLNGWVVYLRVDKK